MIYIQYDIKIYDMCFYIFYISNIKVYNNVIGLVNAVNENLRRHEKVYDKGQRPYLTRE